MSFALLNGIHFDKNIYPYSTGTQINTTEYDWVDSSVSKLGRQSTDLFCKAITDRKLEDFYEFFSNRKFIWYKILFNQSYRIIKILKVTSYDLTGARVANLQSPFPMLVYTLASLVKDVSVTDDDKYKVKRDFNYKYNGIDV